MNAFLVKDWGRDNYDFEEYPATGRPAEGESVSITSDIASEKPSSEERSEGGLLGSTLSSFKNQSRDNVAVKPLSGSNDRKVARLISTSGFNNVEGIRVSAFSLGHSLESNKGFEADSWQKLTRVNALYVNRECQEQPEHPDGRRGIVAKLLRQFRNVGLA